MVQRRVEAEDLQEEEMDGLGRVELPLAPAMIHLLAGVEDPIVRQIRLSILLDALYCP